MRAQHSVLKSKEMFSILSRASALLPTAFLASPPAPSRFSFSNPPQRLARPPLVSIPRPLSKLLSRACAILPLHFPSGWGKGKRGRSFSCWHLRTPRALSSLSPGAWAGGHEAIASSPSPRRRRRREQPLPLGPRAAREKWVNARPLGAREYGICSGLAPPPTPPPFSHRSLSQARPER